MEVTSSAGASVASSTGASSALATGFSVLGLRTGFFFSSAWKTSLASLVLTVLLAFLSPLKIPQSPVSLRMASTCGLGCARACEIRTVQRTADRRLGQDSSAHGGLALNCPTVLHSAHVEPSKNPSRMEAFQALTVLARWIVAQVELLGEMSIGRAVNVILSLSHAVLIA